MKTPLLLALLAGLVFYYYHDSAGPAPALAASNNIATQAARQTINTQVAIAAAPSAYGRWKSGPSAQTSLKIGPNAQTDLKTGPNAQTDFEPFAPSEHATWNQGNPGYTIIAGRNVRLQAPRR